MTAPSIPDAALALHTAFVGMTGSGKTSSAKLAVERVVELGARVCVLDPIKSDWWGITSSADGKTPGLPFVILGGPHGHLALPEGAGEAAAKLVADGTLPLSILDLADFGAGGHARFFTDFAKVLLQRIEGSVYLVMEEAHLFAPKERGGLGPETQAIHFAKVLATAGRSKGIRLIIATQRVQALHNALLGSCDTLVAHRLMLPADRAPVAKWLRSNVDRAAQDEIEASLSSLPTGTGWVCSGVAGLLERTAFPRISTYDNTATPEIGSGKARAVTQAAVDVAAVRAALDATGDDKMSDRKARPAANRGTSASGEDLQAEYDRGRLDGIKEGEQRGRAAGIALGIARAQNAINALRVAGIVDEEHAESPSPDQRLEPAAPTAVAEKPSRAKAAPRESGAGDLNSAARKLLAVLDSSPPVRRTWTQAAALAGIKARGGHFNAGKKVLLEGALVVEEGGLVRIAAPSATAGPAIEDPAARVEQWAAILTGAAPRILRRLFLFGGTATRQQVADALELAPRGGHWNAAWKELRDNDIVQEHDGCAWLTELFLPPGPE